MKKCRDIALLLSKHQERETTPGEKISIYIHLLFCPHCREYKRQLQTIKISLAKTTRTSK
ncbi:TPA: zf-HC2 domain-containing protein [Neisseria lactamica]|uniref:zf-HC2 domain-containing protein n=1 Tax=Neisseria lactamica TaxID=486 RepID=UPI00031BBDF7|nr:zf-HC2 domain-containing protein [Neisseria lactamica]